QTALLHQAMVQRKMEPSVDRSATSAPASVDAPAADSLEETRSTLPIPDAHATVSEASTAGTLSPHQLDHARTRNPLHWHRLRFQADAFSDAPVGSVEFAHAVARYQAEAGLAVDGIAGPETCRHRGCLPESSPVQARAAAPFGSSADVVQAIASTG